MAADAPMLEAAPCASVRTARCTLTCRPSYNRPKKDDHGGDADIASHGSPSLGPTPRHIFALVKKRTGREPTPLQQPDIEALLRRNSG